MQTSEAPETNAVSKLAATAEKALAEVERAIVGKRPVLELVVAGLLADGHILLEDFPGLAKTLIASSFATVLGLEFKRVQFTPDLLPSDITGSSIFDQTAGEFKFRPGPIFTNLLLADEINRAPAKSQAALLEAMQERQVSSDGTTRRLAPPFLVIATQNPIEYEGTYPLPEAQLDRFVMRLSIGYPARDQELQVIGRRLQRGIDQVRLNRIIDAKGLIELQRTLEKVHVSQEVGYYIIDLVSSTRTNPRVQVGASPRGSLALLKVARARAALKGRDFVTPEDVKEVAVPTLAHRISLRPEVWVQKIRPEDVVRECLRTVAIPGGS